MKEIFSNGGIIRFDNKKLRVYLETTLSLTQQFKHSTNYKNLEFYSEDPNWSYAKKSEITSYDISMRIIYDDSIKFDGYKLEIKASEIVLYVNEYRGVLYGIRTLDNLYQNQQLEIMTITEIPTINKRGIIEGFYGVPWSHNDRLDMIGFLLENRLNTYFYAPKDDEYHRKIWRESYPENKQKNITELINKSKDNEIDFVYCISPGNDINLINDKDIKILVDKLLHISTFGVNKFALLMDDINYNLSDEEKAVYHTPGIMHSILSNKVYEQLNKKINNLDFYVCPTEYWQNWDTPYRKDMKKTLHSNIDVFFTGYHTIAQQIPQKDIRIAHESFGHQLAIWDNFPTNDVNKDRLFIGPFINRTALLSDNEVSCFVSNPMNQWNMSKFALITLSDYLWDARSYNPIYSFNKAIQVLSNEWGIKEKNLEHFAYLNKSTRLKKVNYNLDYNDTQQLQEFIDLTKETIKVLESNNIVYTEIQNWIRVMKEEVDYLICYINKEVVKCEQRDYNLGFNFGTLAHARKEESNE